jgi:hypothetical protein
MRANIANIGWIATPTNTQIRIPIEMSPARGLAKSTRLSPRDGNRRNLESAWIDDQVERGEREVDEISHRETVDIKEDTRRSLGNKGTDRERAQELHVLFNRG